MIDLLKKTMYTGLGLAFMTKEKLEDISQNVADFGKLSEKEGKEFFNEISAKSEEARAELRSQIDKVVDETVTKMKLATRDDITKLEKQIKELQESIKGK